MSVDAAPDTMEEEHLDSGDGPVGRQQLQHLEGGGRGIIMIHNGGAVAPTPGGRGEGDNHNT